MTPHDAPELAFRLIGTWWPVDLESDEAASASASVVARGTLGTRDQEATARRRLRDDLVVAARTAREARARLMLLQTELAPGEPMSATLTLYDDDRVRMSPAIGTSPDRVLAVLEESLPTIAPDLAPTAVRRPFTDGEVVRVHRVDEVIEVKGRPGVHTAPSRRTVLVSAARLQAPGPRGALDSPRRHPAHSAVLLRRHRRGLPLHRTHRRGLSPRGDDRSGMRWRSRSRVSSQCSPAWLDARRPRQAVRMPRLPGAH